MEQFMTLKEASEQWGIGERRIRTLCSEGRVEGAKKIGPVWVIPSNAQKPEDNRIKTGRYKKHK